MSQEDNERPRWGDAAVRVPTCTARGWGAGQLGWRRASRDRGTAGEFAKGSFFFF